MPIRKIFDVTSIYWDLEDFPIPEGRCVKSFRENITKVVRELGYCGRIWNVNGYRSYDKMSTEVDEQLESSGIFLFENRKTKFERLMSILMSMLSFARGRVNDPSDEYNFIVIAKDAPDGDNEFVTTLHLLMKFGCNVYLVVPDCLPLAEMPPITMASRVWYWSNLFDGKSPVERIGGEPDGPLEKLKKNYVPSDYELSDGVDDTTSDFSDSSSVDEDDGFPNKLSDGDDDTSDSSDSSSSDFSDSSSSDFSDTMADEEELMSDHDEDI